MNNGVEGQLELAVCCLCGQTFVGYGNNPWPLSHDINDRCCDRCNDTKVIPARLAQMYSKKGKK